MSSNTRSQSTTFAWKRVKLRTPPEGQERVRAKRGPHGLSRRNWCEPLTLTIAYNGGPEAWITVKTRGRVFKRPGWVQLVDLVADINAR